MQSDSACDVMRVFMESLLRYVHLYFPQEHPGAWTKRIKIRAFSKEESFSSIQRLKKKKKKKKEGGGKVVPMLN
jgi:hypothetical protein